MHLIKQTTLKMHLYIISSLLICSILHFPKTNAQCRQRSNCFRPKCYCSSKVFPEMRVKDIPQMVYFAFDDAVTVVVAKHYRRIFTQFRKNPNGCPIKMSLYVSHNYTDYGLVREYYKQGHEIAVHSVNHMRVDNGAFLYKEARLQKEALVQFAGVREKDIVGWRSPYLLTAGEEQPRVLQQLGLKYDISLTYIRTSLQDDRMIWPFTLDYGWPYRCQIPECPKNSHPGFWEVPIISLMDKDDRFPCAYVDGCYSPPLTEQDAYDYLWNNFNSYYQGSRAPLGFHMHAAWFQYPTYDRVKAVNAFLDDILQLKDVYVVSVKQMLEWMEHPTPVSRISNLKSWSCDQSKNNIFQLLPKEKTLLNSRRIPSPTNSLNTNNISNTHTSTNGFNPIKKVGDYLFSKGPNSMGRKRVQQRFQTLPIIDNNNQWNTKFDATNQFKYTRNMKDDQLMTFPPKIDEFSPVSDWIKMKNNSSHNAVPWNISHSETNGQKITTQIPITNNWQRPLNTHTTIRMERFTNDRNTWKHNQRIETKDISSSNLSKGLEVNVSTQEAVRLHSGISRQITEWTDMSAQSTLVCQQNVNCFLPKCFCKTSDIPLVSVYRRPQLVLLSFDGPINHSVYSKYETIFGTRVNPDRCPIRGTLFISPRTNSSLTKRLHNMGLEISLLGILDTSYRSYQKMRRDIINQVRSLTSSPYGIQMRDIKGWRSPSLKSIGDTQYKVLKDVGFVYDSTLISERVMNGKSGFFPFTLDYGWTEQCQEETCPQSKYPGLWEIPVPILEDIKHGYSCEYIDDCPQPMVTAEETEDFLWNNFLWHYQSNRKPFSINLTQKWFHLHYDQNYQGLLNFIDRLLQLGNVYFVSNIEAIKWIQSPVKWSDIPVRC